MAPDSSLLMSSKALSSRDMAAIATPCCVTASPTAALVGRRRSEPLRSSSVCKGWSQVVARGRQKAALALVRAIGGLARLVGELTGTVRSFSLPIGTLARTDELRFDPFAISYIADRSRDERALGVLDRTQADLDGEFRAVLAPAE